MLSVGVPWTNCYGAARSLIALGPLLTLIFTQGSDLVFLTSGDPTADGRCTGAKQMLLFCLSGADQNLEVKRWAAAAVLCAVVSGWRPRFTCVPHAYVAHSFFYGLSGAEGGDQVASILALLLVPVCLTDCRKWHWLPFDDEPDGQDTTTFGQLWQSVATIAIVLVKLQLSWLYIQAGISKLSNEAWVSGTAMYYWTRNVNFGAPGWEEPVVHWATSQAIVSAAMTWIPIALEVSIGISLLLPKCARVPLLCAGIAFHMLIGLIIGLWSFAIIMCGCLVFLVSPAGVSLQIRRHPQALTQHSDLQLTRVTTSADPLSTPSKADDMVDNRRKIEKPG